MRTAGFVLGVMICATLPVSAQTVPPPAAPLPGSQAYGGKTLVPAQVACTDLPTATVPTPSLRIIAPHAADLHAGAARNELVVLNAGTPQGMAIGQRYFTRRVLPPINREMISATDRGSVRTTGWLTVVAADERFALGRVDYACVTVEAGDYLEAYVEPAVPATALDDGPPNFADMARVLFGIDRHEAFGAGDLLSIDRGQSRGMTVGTRVAFYRDRQIGTPLFELGSGVVVEVSAETAKVAVERAAPDVKIGDYVAIRRAP
jgi:hypothetical protein